MGHVSKVGILSCMDENVKRLSSVLYCVECVGLLKSASKVEDIEAVLKDNGYTAKAVKEILKWYDEGAPTTD